MPVFLTRRHFPGQIDSAFILPDGRITGIFGIFSFADLRYKLHRHPGTGCNVCVHHRFKMVQFLKCRPVFKSRNKSGQRQEGFKRGRSIKKMCIPFRHFHCASSSSTVFRHMARKIPAKVITAAIMPTVSKLTILPCTVIAIR